MNSWVVKEVSKCSVRSHRRGEGFLHVSICVCLCSVLVLSSVTQKSIGDPSGASLKSGGFEGRQLRICFLECMRKGRSEVCGVCFNRLCRPSQSLRVRIAHIVGPIDRRMLRQEGMRNEHLGRLWAPEPGAHPASPGFSFRPVPTRQ